MNKAQSVREAMNAAIPDLVTNPERLKVFADAGKIVTSMARGDAFDYVFTLNVLVLDFTGDADVVFLALARWMRVNQPDVLLNADTRDTAIEFEADFNDSTSVDLSVKLKLSESVVVNEDGSMTHVAEPQPDYCMGGEWTN